MVFFYDSENIWWFDCSEMTLNFYGGGAICHRLYSWDLVNLLININSLIIFTIVFIIFMVFIRGRYFFNLLI